MEKVIAYFDRVESEACLRINSVSRSRYVRSFFTLISKLGDGGFWLAMTAMLLFIHGPGSLRSVLVIAITAGVGVLVYTTLKNRLFRERPYVNHGGIQCGTAPLDRYSFPSGHTLHAVSFTILLTAFEPLMLFITVPFALLVAASRVILGLHYPSDVLAGALLGASLAGTSLTLFQSVL